MIRDNVAICICSEPLPKIKPGHHLLTCPFSPWKQRKELGIITMSQPQKSLQDIQNIIDSIRFKDRSFKLMTKGDGFLLQMEYYEADVNKPGSEPVKQSTRKYYLSPYMTTSEVVETAWLCVQRSQLHVASEHFRYAGRQVYSQHFNVSARIEICDNEDFDTRTPPSTSPNVYDLLPPFQINDVDFDSMVVETQKPTD
jgi:hypothetical protein